MSFKLYYRCDDEQDPPTLGHVHVRVFISEFGPATTHGKNGDLVFRWNEWNAFREFVEAALETPPDLGSGYDTPAAVTTVWEFIPHGEESKTGIMAMAPDHGRLGGPHRSYGSEGPRK